MGCDIQFVNINTLEDTQFVSMEGSSSKDTQVVSSDLSIVIPKRDVTLSLPIPIHPKTLNLLI